MAPYPPPLPPATRDDRTPQAGSHASDHNQLSTALADVLEVLGVDPTDGTPGRLSDTGLKATFAPKPTRTQAPATLVAAPVDSGGRYPCWLNRSRTRIFANARNVLRYSDDDTGTWIDVKSLILTQEIDAVRDLDNGELLVTTSPASKTTAPGEVWVSSGFRTDPQTATWTKVLTAHAVNNYFTGSWGISVHDNIVLLNEYGSKLGGTASARYCYRSLDYGKTWTTIYDVGSAVGNHLHGVCYDPYWDRIWLTYGDDTSAIVYSDNLGETWTVAQSSASPTGDYQSVGIVALPNCVLLASDGQPNGILRIPRTAGKDAGTYTPQVAHQIDASTGLAWLGHQPFRARMAGDDGLVLFPFAPETTTGRSRVIATRDGYTFNEIWQDTADSTSRGVVTVLGPTARGRLLITSNDGRFANYTKWRGSMPWGY